MIVVSFIGFSQDDAELYKPEKKKDKLKFIFNFDARNSFVNKQPVKFSGIKIGLGNKKNRFGLGFHQTRRPVLQISQRDEPTATDTSLFEFGYSSFFYERVLLQTKRWELSAPIHLNFGELVGSYRDTAGNNIPFLRRNTTSWTFSVKSHFKIWRWFGVAAGVGYNLLANGDTRARKALSAPFYSYGVKIFLGELWKLAVNRNDYRKSEWVE